MANLDDGPVADRDSLANANAPRTEDHVVLDVAASADSNRPSVPLAKTSVDVRMRARKKQDNNSASAVAAW